MEHLDVLIVGAGISGIGAAYHLQTRCPRRTYAILEGRDNLGGTWDLFRYPGIRSDSDMHTLGYRFRPWEDRKAIADGPAILRYLADTASDNGIDRHIRFGHYVKSVSWSSEDARWTVTLWQKETGEDTQMTCGFLYMCTGYYDYEKGYTPEFAGRERFEGEIVHPQKWSDDVEYEGKRVVVIGSGATAVTLVPELAKKAAHVTMLQRSPSYILSVPEEDAIALALRRRLPPKVAYGVTRWKNVLMSLALFGASRRAPSGMKRLLIGGVKKALGPDYDVDKHFTPHYEPWDQRLCLVPDGDLFHAIREGRASVVTDHIETFTEKGIRLRSGEELDADLIVTATGLNLLFLSGMDVLVDGETIEPKNLMTYKAMMFGDVPNMALSFGYTNASWTLKADLTSEYVCRLLNHMEKRGYEVCVARQNDPDVEEIPFLNLASGYITRSLADLPKQGSKEPWRLKMNYAADVLEIRHGKVDDGVMQFR